MEEKWILRLCVVMHLYLFAQLSSREEKDVVKRKRTAWLKYNLLLNEKVGTSPAFSLLSSTMSGTLKSLQSDPLGDRTSVYDPPQLAFDLQVWFHMSMLLLHDILRMTVIATIISCIYMLYVCTGQLTNALVVDQCTC